MDSKRKDKRFKEKNEVLIQYTLDGKNPGVHKEINAKTHDISLGGARIVSKKSFPLDSVIRIQINLSGSGRSVRVDGLVKWVRLKKGTKSLYEIGIEFLHKISTSVLSLIWHLYGEDNGVPSSVS